MSKKDEKYPGRDDDPLAAEELLKISEEIAAEFPPPRLGTELVLLEVDPQRAHAYWNVDLEDFLDAKLDSGSASPSMVLRMYDVSGVEFDGANALETFDTEIQGLQGHWYMDLWKPGRSYVADIGFRRGDGTLAFIARSNAVHTPAATESPFSEAEAVNVASRETVADVQARAPAVLKPTATGNAIVQDSYPPEDAPWPEPDRAANDAPAVREKMDEFYRDMAPSESAITEADVRMEREVESGESPVPSIVEGPAPEPPAPSVVEGPAPLESHISYSSFEQGRQNVELEINTELHIYGRAKPGSELVLFGQKVQLRPDGTFSIRKPLPQGAVVIPLLFQSNGESK